jgi:predicted alpha-1,2-mannosidase
MNKLNYVNPLQGTAYVHHFSNGNTLPLSARPLGMAGWSPQTTDREGTWFFHPDHRHFQGIRLTHQPSPWIGDYGHFLLMPQTGALALEPTRRSSSFRPEQRIHRPDYIRYDLIRYRTTMELTPTERCASIRLTFRGDENEDRRLLLMTYEGESHIVINAEGRTITGYTRANSGGVPSNFAQYFVIAFDCELDLQGSGLTKGCVPLSGALMGTGEQTGAYAALRLPTGQASTVVRVATSFISIEQAQLNLQQEIGGKGFDDVLAESSAAWEDMLGRIDIDGGSSEQLRVFYTGLYRNLLFPRKLYEWDASGSQIHYSPHSGNVLPGPMHTDNGFWDTYRTTYPLFSLLYPSELQEILQSWVNVYKESGWMPKWVSPGEQSAMPGTLIDVVIADACAKGLTDFELEKAYEGLLKHAMTPAKADHLGRRGLDAYMELGYIPCDRYHESVSNTLDYVYGDFCIAQIAKQLGRTEDYEMLMKRASHYRMLLDPSIGFMRGRNSDGSWKSGFDPHAWGDPYCEGGPWQSSWAVQHDLLGLADALGGRAALKSRIDELMTASPAFKIGSYGFEIHEMSEMAAVDFGQFAISNQPSFHIPYIYTALGYPSEANDVVRKTMKELFLDRADGLPGDEDNGSLCAWYLFGAIGLYPLTPGVAEYAFGSPIFERVELKLENGCSIVISAPNTDDSNKYVRAIRLNGEAHEKLYFTFDQLRDGANLSFEMCDTPPVKTYTDAQLPYSMSIAASSP